MENQKNNTLYLTSHCFTILLEGVLAEFRNKHTSAAIGRVTQLYGFGNYNPTLPNLRQELEKLTGGFINGKYLYDKSRELRTGKPVLKLNGYYKIVLFQYLGYEGISDFIKKEITDKTEQERQWDLNKNAVTRQTYYYVAYHFGEYKEIVKSQVTVLNGWKNIQYKYLYPSKDGSFKSFNYHGTVKKRADILHIPTKTLMDGKLVDGGENILYVGHSEPGDSAFIVGVFSAFDINNRVIAGKLIHEKCASKEEMIAKSTTRKIPAYIAQELRNVRIENDSTIPNDVLEISAKSPYSITYEKIPGDYRFQLLQNGEVLGDFSFTVDKNTFKISPMTSGVLINKDNFELIQNGSVIHFSFQLTGIALFTRLEAFIKTYYLNKGERAIRGVYSGLDIENRLISGDLDVYFDAF